MDDYRKILRRVGLALIVFLELFVAACSAKDSLPALRDGDLIFQTSRSSQSVAIQRATGSSPKRGAQQ